MKANNIFVYILLVSMSFVSLSGCKSEDQLYAEVEDAVTFDNTALGQKQKTFFDKYNVLFQYKWDRNAFARNAVANPASEQDVLPYMEVMEELFFKVFDTVANDNQFAAVKTPLTIYLIGSGINYGGSEDFGESSVGQAGNIQPNRLTLGGLSEFGTLLRRKGNDTQFLNMIYEAAATSYPGQAGLIGFFYHEYTHYLNTRFDIPTAFASAAVANYLKGSDGFRRLTDQQAYERGFFIPYGMQNEMEDFATYVQIMVWKSPQEIKDIYIKSSMSQTKYNEVNKYFENIGLDLNKLRIYLQTQEVKDRVLAIKRKYEI